MGLAYLKRSKTALENLGRGADTVQSGFDSHYRYSLIQNLNYMNRPQEQYDRLNARLPFAGGFETALIEAWMKADGINKTRLENAFEDLLKAKK